MPSRREITYLEELRLATHQLRKTLECNYAKHTVHPETVGVLLKYLQELGLAENKANDGEVVILKKELKELRNRVQAIELRDRGLDRQAVLGEESIMGTRFG